MKVCLRLSMFILNVVTVYCGQSVVVGCGPDNPTILPYIGPASSFLEGHVNWARV